MKRILPRYRANRGSHLPVLIELVPKTTGSILELGVGYQSSPYLHWACWPKRRVVSYESSPNYYDFARQWERDNHEVHCVESWEDVDLSEPWAIAFVDNSPTYARAICLKKLTHAEFVVVHDTESSSYPTYGCGPPHCFPCKQ